jgi:hypothetical protein
MPLHDPVAAYSAASNEEALLVRNALRGSGVEAYVTEDLSVIGAWAGGLLPGIHNPQVWVDRADVERAVPVLEEYERQGASRREDAAAGPPVEVACEECGTVNTFSAAQHGSVQQCHSCAAFIDVGEDDAFDDWQVPGDEEADDAEGP